MSLRPDSTKNSHPCCPELRAASVSCTTGIEWLPSNVDSASVDALWILQRRLPSPPLLAIYTRSSFVWALLEASRYDRNKTTTLSRSRGAHSELTNDRLLPWVPSGYSALVSTSEFQSNNTGGTRRALKWGLGI